MRRFLTATGVAALGALAIAGAVAAAGPGGSVVADVLGMTQAQVQDLRHDGLSLAQIATRQGVTEQKVIDALAQRWTERIEVRVENGALTASQATALKAEVQARAKTMVEQTAPGGMRGAAVGAGPAAAGRGARAGLAGGNGTGNGPGPRGTGTGTGTCDGTGPHGAGRP